MLQRFTEFHRRFAPYFFRTEVRNRSGRYLQALFRPLERKNGWQIAAAMGEHDPNGAQRLLHQAIWDEEAVRDEPERFVAEQFGDPDKGMFVIAGWGRWLLVRRSLEDSTLDGYEVRSWRSGHRHITLSMRAPAFVAWARYRADTELASTTPRRAAGKKSRSAS